MFNQLFSLVILVLGIVMLVTNFQVDNALRGKQCNDTALNNANKGILVLAVTAIVSSLGYMACLTKCTSGVGSVYETEVYVGFSLLLGIVLIALGSIVHNRAAAVMDCSAAKHHTTLLITVGVIMTVLSGGYLSFYAYENYGGKDAMAKARGYMKGSGM